MMVDDVYMPPDPSDTAERLVEAAFQVLRQEGIEGLSLRRVAREAGVSHGAPLRHFPSFAALCAELAGRGFQGLEEALDKAAAQLPPGSDPTDRLAAAGRAYIASAVAEPGLFALMFRPEMLDPAQPRFATHAPAAFDRLVVLVRAAQDAGLQPERETRTLAGAIWAAVHGLAALWSSGALASVTGASLDSISEAALASILTSTPRPAEGRRPEENP